MQDQVSFSSALNSFIREAQACANEMLENSLFIEKELPNVTMTDKLHGVTVNMCTSLTATGQAAIKELSDWMDASFNPQDFAKYSNNIINLLSRDLSNLHGLVMALEAQSDIDRGFSSTYLLVSGSATNILLAFTRAADAAKVVSDAAESALPTCQCGFICSICGAVANLVQMYDSVSNLKYVRTGFLGKMEINHPSANRENAYRAFSLGDARAVYEYELELVPSYCPKCNAVYCKEHWQHWTVFDDDVDYVWYDSIRGRCPHGHERMLQD